MVQVHEDLLPAADTDASMHTGQGRTLHGGMPEIRGPMRIRAGDDQDHGKLGGMTMGRFIGTIDGEYAECTIDGEVLKQAK